MATRAEQKEQRRNLILMNALELFNKKGYADTKIADIAEASHMSMGLLFHYFESKEQLFRELIAIGAQGASTPQNMEFSNPIDYFRGFLTELFKYACESPWVFSMFLFMMHASSSDSLPEDIRSMVTGVNQIEVSANVIAEGQKQGLFRKGDPMALSLTFWSSLQGVMEQRAVVKDVPLPEIDWLLSILTDGAGKEE